MTRIRIKICGVTREEDAISAAELGADFLGLNFWPGSPRCVDVELARRVADSVRGRLGLVGVFVDQPADQVEEIASRVGLDLLQFHGHESAEEVGGFGDRAIKAFRVGMDFDAGVLEEFPEVWGILFDCAHPTLYGGSGTSWPFERVMGLCPHKPKIVAGGLRSSNVRAAITSSGADIVDVCSGIESQAGVKDRKLMMRFIREVHYGEEE